LMNISGRCLQAVCGQGLQIFNDCVQRAHRADRIRQTILLASRRRTRAPSVKGIEVEIPCSTSARMTRFTEDLANSSGRHRTYRNSSRFSNIQANPWTRFGSPWR
jgi:hypothetical protein